MDDHGIWAEVRNLNGCTLRTLDRHQPFEIVSVTEHGIIVCPQSTGKERPIQRDGMESAYRRLLATGKLTLGEIENEFAPYNPVYVAAILAQMAGVRYTTRPIVLRLQKIKSI